MPVGDQRNETRHQTTVHSRRSLFEPRSRTFTNVDISAANDSPSAPRAQGGPNSPSRSSAEGGPSLPNQADDLSETSSVAAVVPDVMSPAGFSAPPGTSPSHPEASPKPVISVVTSVESNQGGNDKSEAAHLASDVYSILTVRGSGDEQGSPQAGAEFAATSLPGDPTLVENAILARVAAIPRGRTRGPPLPTRSVPLPGEPPLPERSLRRFFRRGGRSGSRVPPPRGVVCVFCGELLHFPAQLPCSHLADLECLVAHIPLSECPLCKMIFSGTRSLADLVIPEYLLRKMERDRISYLNKLRGKDRRIFTRTDPMRSQRFPQFTRRKITDQDLLDPDQSPGRTPKRIYHRLNLFRFFRRKHPVEVVGDEATRKEYPDKE